MRSAMIFAPPPGRLATAPRGRRSSQWEIHRGAECSPMTTRCCGRGRVGVTQLLGAEKAVLEVDVL
jgi:hypothetical protein